MKKLLLISFLLGNQLYAQQTQECFGDPTPLANHQGRLVSQIKMAKEYFMVSEDPSVVGTYQERTQKLMVEVKSVFDYFINQRTNEYKNVLCKFRNEKTCTNGTHRLKTCDDRLVVPNIYTLVVNSVEKTQSGDLKSFSQNGNTFLFSAGRSSPGRATAFVSVMARYSDSHIKNIIDNELQSVRTELNKLNLPTDLSTE